MNTFKSRRKENKDEKDYYDPHTKSHNWNEEKFLRRYRYQHLRSDSTVPMSVRNVDRHGLGNLKKDETKAFDRIKVPPFLIYIIVLGWGLYVIAKMNNNEEMKFVNL